MLFQQRDSADWLPNSNNMNISAGQGGTGGTYSQRHPYSIIHNQGGFSVSIDIVRNGYWEGGSEPDLDLELVMVMVRLTGYAFVNQVPPISTSRS